MTALALDVGNSSAKAAVWDGTAWGPIARLPHDPGEWPSLLTALAPGGVERAGIASVVPPLTEPLAAAVRQRLGVDPVVVSAALPLPFRMAYRTPATLGADRLAAAVAAWTGWGGSSRPVVALDAGTAVTLDVVAVETGGPVYLGGAIAPGPDLLRLSLSRGTGALPHVEWGDTAPSIGRTTHEAIQAGLSSYVVEGVAGLLRRTAGTLGEAPIVVATGGWAPWLAERVVEIEVVVPSLVLDGIRLLATR